MKRYERGSTRLWAWAGSQDPDDLSFAILSNSGTVVSSITATQSGTGAWYAIASVPNSLFSDRDANYYTRRWIAWASSKTYPDEELFKVIDVTAMGAPSSYYASPADVRDKLDAINASDDNVTNDLVTDAIEDTMSRIDSILVRAYNLPFESTPKIIRTVTRDLSLYEIGQRFTPRNNEGDLPEFLIAMRDRAEETLEALAVGSQFIVTDSGTPWPGNIQTGNEADQVKHIFYDGVNETFTELDADEQRQDPEFARDTFDRIWDR